jgi:hypothetical protein
VGGDGRQELTCDAVAGSWSWRIVERIDLAIPVLARVMVGLVGPPGSFRRRLLLDTLVVVGVVGVLTAPLGDNLQPPRGGP